MAKRLFGGRWNPIGGAGLGGGGQGDIVRVEDITGKLPGLAWWEARIVRSASITVFRLSRVFITR